ncbi:MAG: hypothetical protein AAF653_13555 [Chloroflexota bacterium]
MVIGIGTVIILIIVALLIAAFLSPMESLSWYAGWVDDSVLDVKLPDTIDAIGAEHVVVYLTGISDVEGETLKDEETVFIARLREEIERNNAHIIVIEDIFPYSVSNTALTGQRVFAWFWRWANSLRKSKNPIAFLVNIRNIFQVAVSADSRYGPIYNDSMANYITNNLVQRGYVVGSGVPLTLIGYSGGGQISLGAAPFLRNTLETSVTVISVGGVMCAPKRLKNIDMIYHLYGARDNVQLVGIIIFPARWRLRYFSTWNRGRRGGKIIAINMGEMIHTGAGAYYDPESFHDDGTSFQEHTLQTIMGLLMERTSQTSR